MGKKRLTPDEKFKIWLVKRAQREREIMYEKGFRRYLELNSPEFLLSLEGEEDLLNLEMI